jgi:hypothetical protein
MERSNLVSHALKELSLAYDRQPEVLDGVDIPEVLRAVRAFSEEGYSGGSAGIVTGGMPDGVLRTLLRFEPLTPLTGADEEWLVHGHPDCYAQNVRCSHVFKRLDGTAYDIDAVVFRDPDGSCWNTADSWRDISFPYTPTTEVVDRKAA